MILLFGYYSYIFSGDVLPDLFLPTLGALTLLVGVMCVFLVKTIFGGVFRITDFIEIVCAFALSVILLVGTNSINVCLVLLAVLVIYSSFMLARKKPEELE